METLGRTLILAGVFIAAAGVLFLLFGRVPFLGRLPGDFSFQRAGFSFYFPLATSIVISLLLTIGLNVILRIFGR